MTLAQALLIIPPGFHLRCSCEQDPETGSVFGSAALFTEPPEDGWPSPRHPADKFLDKVIVAISTDETDHEAFERLTVNMVVDRYGTDRQKAEARAALDQMAAERERRAQPEAKEIKAAW